MQIFSKIFSCITTPFNYKLGVCSIGPNNLAELLKQFNQPIKKEKNNKDVIKDYTIKETMAKLEVDMLTMEPTSYYRGFQSWYDNKGNKFLDWIPCAIRPEVIYCSYGKN
jgi:hypothetical protein